jgi:hypothetical protein
MLELQAILIGVVILGMKQVRTKKIRIPDLLMPLPTPLKPCPYTMDSALRERDDDSTFITTMGFDLVTFHYILDSAFAARCLAPRVASSDSLDTSKTLFPSISI